MKGESGVDECEYIDRICDLEGRRQQRVRMPECSCFSIHDAQRVFQSSVASIMTTQQPYLVLNKGHSVEICTVREGVLHLEAKLENERIVRYAHTIPLLTKETILLLVYTEDDALSLVTWRPGIGFENNASVEWTRGNVEGDIKCSAIYQLSKTPDHTSMMVAFQFSSSWMRCVCIDIRVGSAHSIDAVSIYASESDLLLQGALDEDCRKEEWTDGVKCAFAFRSLFCREGR